MAISGPLEPSHGLLDAAMQQWDSRSLKHIGPEKCHSREEEVQNLKSAASTVSLEGGKLKLVDSNSLQDLEIEGSLQVLQALRRRGVAYHFAQLISWDVHERYIDTLFKYVTRPAQPGYRKVSLRQVLRADKLAFAKLAEQGEDIRADANGKLPLDIAMQSVLQEYELLVALLPLPETEGKGKKGKFKALGDKKGMSPIPRGSGRATETLRGRVAKAKGTPKAESLIKEVARQNGCLRSSGIREPRLGTNGGAVFATAFSWVSARTQIARRAITIASYSHVGVTARSRSAL